MRAERYLLEKLVARFFLAQTEVPFARIEGDRVKKCY